MHLILDYETRSEADLKKLGPIEYAKHPSTEILCVAWRLGTRDELQKRAPAQCWSPFIASPYGEFKRAMCDLRIKKVAHVASFEQAITTYTLPRLIKNLPHNPPENWICTAALAAALALPRSLEGACQALGLSVQKDMEGRRLILKYCKPRTAWNTWTRSGRPARKTVISEMTGLLRETGGEPAKWHSKLSDLKRLMQYCATDVEAETELFLRVPPLNEFERKVWVLDQKINQRGFAIDMNLVDSALSMIDEETKNLDRETREISGGRIKSTKQRDAVLDFIREEGHALTDIRAKTVSDSLATDSITGLSRRLLQIRQASSKTSTAKYLAFKMRAGRDQRVRDNLVYHAASTGRWGGAGVQPQNFPRPTMKVDENVIDAVKSRDLEWVRFLYGSPMNVFSNCLRSVIIASEGKELHCADYSSIEARMLFWFAKHQAGISAFEEGRDLYKEMAAYIYNRLPEEIAKDSIERFVGKGVILGCGYNMGGPKFRLSCQSQGVTVSEETAERAVKAYRTKHAPVVQLWNNIERAAIAATQNPGKRYSINRTTWFVKGKFLWCELPSERRLAYYGPCIKLKKTPWGKEVAQLHHYSVNQFTRKWALDSTYGGKLVENIVQAASRDLMAAAMLRAEEYGYEIVLSVHDEGVGEHEKNKKPVKDFPTVMAELTEWAKGAPIKAEGWSGGRYRK